MRTPIKQDVKKGKPRFYPWDIHWNYGMLPQTWEDPTHASTAAGGFGCVSSAFLNAACLSPGARLST